MKAIVVQEGEPMLVSDRPVPLLRDSDVLIEVEAVALNPTDWKHLEYKLVEDGCLVGCDFAGRVVELGKSVKKALVKGDRVAGVAHGGNSHIGRHEDGAFAEYIVAKGNTWKADILQTLNSFFKRAHMILAGAEDNICQVIF